MADITASCTIVGGQQDAVRPFSWHVWDVLVPSAALAGAGPDDILLPDRFKTNTRLLDLRTQVIDNVTVATSLLMDVEMALRAIADGALSVQTNMLAAVDLETEDTTILATGSTVIEDFGDAVAGTNDRVINLELTKTGAVSTDCRFLVAALIGRTEF